MFDPLPLPGVRHVHQPVRCLDDLDPPFDVFPSSDTVELCVSDRELASLAEFVQRSFLRDAGNQLISMKPGIYGC